MYKQLKRYNIMFLDQIISTEGTYLLRWQDLKYRNILSKVTKKPGWYNIIKNIVCITEDTLKLKNTWKLKYNECYTAVKEIKMQDNRYKEWIAAYKKEANE